jgi:hypothetical protein
MEWRQIEKEDDPDRCQGIDSRGQCKFIRAAPSLYCPRHGGNRAIAAAEKENVRNYFLGKWRTRVNQFADNPNVKSLREEIGILRMMLETILNKCQDENDLLMYCGKIQELVGQIQKVVAECHRLEERTGVLLDKQTILTLADTMVKIIGEHVTDSDALEMIGTKMVDVVAQMGGLKHVADARLNA